MGKERVKQEGKVRESELRRRGINRWGRRLNWWKRREKRERNRWGRRDRETGGEGVRETGREGEGEEQVGWRGRNKWGQEKQVGKKRERNGGMGGRRE